MDQVNPETQVQGEPPRVIAPVTLWKTKSFWLGIFPLLLTLLETLFAQAGTGGPLVDLLTLVTGSDAATVQAFLLKITPIWGLIIAWQRGGWGSGVPRPYTLDPKKEEAVKEAIVNGKTAFDAGKALGKQIKNRIG